MSRKPAEVEDLRGPIRELREYALGNLDVEHSDVLPFAGLVDDPEIRDLLAFFSEVYEPMDDTDMPQRFEETELAQRLLKRFATESAAKAVEDGDVTRAAYLTGIPSYTSDVSGLQAINRLAEWLDNEQIKMIYLAANMGRGKTDLSLTFLEIVEDHYHRVSRTVDAHVPQPEFATNFAVDAPDRVRHEYIDNYDDFQSWVQQGSSDDVKWFVFDEASTELTAQSGENAQKVVKKMNELIKKARKSGLTGMIVIGHDRGDVHPLFRSLCDYVDKTGLKTASFYAGVNNRQPTGHLFDVEGIPPTSWGFDTDDSASWDWGEGIEEDTLGQEDLEEEIKLRAARLWLDTELTQEKVATAISTPDFSISRTTIGRYADQVREQRAQDGHSGGDAAHA